MVVVLLFPLQAAAKVGPGALQACVQANAHFYSTEEDFLTHGPEPVDGNPVISDGDLLGRTASGCTICARNQDLLLAFGLTMDLGLDGADVVASGEDRIAVFSTELDAPSAEAGAGLFRAGDLLASNGAVIPNEVLLQNFAFGYDIGLDAVHQIGEPRALINFWTDAAQFGRQDWLEDPSVLIELFGAHDVDIWVSTEGTAPTPSAPAILDGDLLSTRAGSTIASNDQLLPSSVPAGVPVRGVDFGLDAVTADRSGQLGYLQISVEIPRREGSGFEASDVLGPQLGWKAVGPQLTECFEAQTELLGLDAIAVPEPSGPLGLVAGIVLLAVLRGRRYR